MADIMCLGSVNIKQPFFVPPNLVLLTNQNNQNNTEHVDTILHTPEKCVGLVYYITRALTPNFIPSDVLCFT